jgi:hypothetical protein
MNATIDGGIIVVAGGQVGAISAQDTHYAVPRTQFGMCVKGLGPAKENVPDSTARSRP